MAKKNRALKVLDKNSLPKVLDILEVPKSKESKSSNEAPDLGFHGENHVRNFPIQARRRRRKPLATSKTPKISNIGWNKNITTRRARTKNTRPPKPKPISSATKKRKGLGSSLLTPYGVNMARLKNGRTPDATLTPSLRKSPNVLKHYDRLKPITCNLYKQHKEQKQQEERSSSILGKKEMRRGLDQKTMIHRSPPMKRSPNETIGKFPIAPLKELSVTNKTSPKGNINECEKKNENENKNSSDDMDCDSSDGLSLNSSSSSSPPSPSSPEKRKSVSTGRLSYPEEKKYTSSNDAGLVSNSEGKYQFTDKIDRSQSNQIVSSGFDDAEEGGFQMTASSLNKTRDEIDVEMTDGKGNKLVPTSTSTLTSATTTDSKVFNFEMSDNSNLVDNELLGSTIGDSRFVHDNIDHDSVLTTFSSVGDQETEVALSKKKDDRAELRTPFFASQFHRPSFSVSHELCSKTSYHLNECEEEVSIEAWSIDGHSSSPFFFVVGGKKYGHPALPPGWAMRISRGENRPVYSHPDHGRTWHCPIKLTPNMVYVKTCNGKYVKQIKSNGIEPSNKDLFTQRSVRGEGHNPQTPPSIRESPPQPKKRSEALYLPLEQDEEDSTSKFMRDISRLSEGLRENSSSNLQKVEKVKTINRKTSDLAFSNTARFGLKAQSRRLFSSQDSDPHQLHQFGKTSDLRTLGPPIGKTRFNEREFDEREESTSTQDHEIETPSTMSALLHQYEATLDGCNDVTAYSTTRNTIVRRGETKQLSPFMEATLQSDPRQTLRNIESDHHGSEDILCNVFTDMKVGWKKDTLPSKFNETDFTKSENQNKKSITNLPRLQKSTDTEHIEAWFTPKVQIQDTESQNINCTTTLKCGAKKKKGRRPSLYPTDDILESEGQTNINMDLVSPTLKGIRTSLDHQSILYDDEWSPQEQPRSIGKMIHPRQKESDEEQEANYGSSTDSPIRYSYKAIAEVNPDMSTLKRISTQVKRPSIGYDDEWSPMAKSELGGEKTDRNPPKTFDQREEKYQNSPNRATRDDHEPIEAGETRKDASTLTKSLEGDKYGNRDQDSNQSNDIPRQSRYSDQREMDENSDDLNSIDSHLQSDAMMKDQRPSNEKSANDMKLEVQETRSLSESNQKYDSPVVQNDKIEKGFDKMSNIDRFENASNGSSGVLVTKKGSGRYRSVGNQAKDSEINPHEGGSVTVVVQAHAAKKISHSAITVLDTDPVMRKEAVDNNRSSTTIETVRSDACDESDGSHATPPREASTTRQCMKPNNNIGQAIETDESKSLLSRESFHSSEGVSPDISNSGNITNDSPIQMDIETESKTGSENEQSISQFSSNHESGGQESMVSTNPRSISSKTENPDEGCNHEFGIDEDGASSCNGSFTFADDPSDNFQQSPGQSINSSSDFAGTTSSSDKISSPKEHSGCCIQETYAGSEVQSPIESPVQPTTLEKIDSFLSPQIEESDDSVESPFLRNPGRKTYITSQSKRKKLRMSWRVLNPPHPTCSLQRLEELKLQRDLKRRGSKRPKKGGRTKRTKYVAARRRKQKRGRSC